MPFYNNVYYPFTSETPGTLSSAGIPSLLNSPQSQYPSSIPSQSAPAPMPAITGVVGGHLPAFKFRARLESVDWRRISAINVDRVASELDINTLQENIMAITFCNMDNERCPYCQNPVDPVLLKLFRLAQLNVEYLLHSQEYLTCNLHTMEERITALGQEKEQIRREMVKQSEEIKSLKEECKRRKKIITTQQTMIQAGVSNYHKCQHCDKAFMNYSFLQSHTQRRHQGEYDIAEKQKKGQTGKLQDEINKLKEQLELTRSQLETEQHAYMEKLSKEHEYQRTKEEETIKRFEKWKDEEKDKLGGEIGKMREMFIKEFKELSTKNTALENELLEMKKSNAQLKSNIGVLKEDRDTEIEGEKNRYHEDLQSLKELLQKQEEKWTERIQKVHKEHDKEKYQLQSDLQRLQSSLSEDEKVSINFYKKRIEELGQKLKEQNVIICTQKEQIKEHYSKPPERITENAVLTPASQAPVAKPVTHEQALSEHILEPIEELSEEDKVSDSTNVLENEIDCNQLLIRALKKNPSLTKELRPILEQTVEEKLESLGLKPGLSSGISSDHLNKIMVTMESQREMKEKKMPDFQNIREHLSDKLRIKVQERRATLSSVLQMPTFDHLSSDKQKKSRSNSLPTSQKPQMMSKSIKKPSPQPVLRTKKPAPKTSTPKTPPFSSEEDSEGESFQKPHKEPKVILSKTPAPSSIKTMVKSVESDTDWTEESEMEEIDPKQLQGYKKEATETNLRSNNIKEMVGDIEKQLASRGAKKKPVGGVDALQVPKRKEVIQELKFSEVDDDDWDISSLEEDKPLVAKPEKGQPAFTVRKSFESNSSTNTSVWGPSTAKGVNRTGLPEGDTTSTFRSSLATVTDWSETSDIEQI
ncbi:zinc finger protein DZIP1-like [Acipenser oxyrinchus oxyrinchus]|uniref:Zinc finger protein DZIP1-like n=1 Tax=Acipenser oxyrinchus oxyrinchus TaxID=40147 RepID=A0AAD8G947_ACIOX|nr:zinc finger protein DZIP1-like [Acipenser oxyrinchus oxyrinchus]